MDGALLFMPALPMFLPLYVQGRGVWSFGALLPCSPGWVEVLHQYDPDDNPNMISFHVLNTRGGGGSQLSVRKSGRPVGEWDTVTITGTGQCKNIQRDNSKLLNIRT